MRYIIHLLLIMQVTHLLGHGDINSTLNELDSIIKSREDYSVERRSGISIFALNDAEELDQRYVLSHELYLGYKRRLIGIFILILIFAIVVSFMLIKIHRVNNELREARHEVELRARSLSQINAQLVSLNEELAQTNRIKDLYIIESLYGDSDFVDNVERMCKVLVRKIKSKQYADILDVVGGMGIKRERRRMSTAFDSAFLKLFPNFIEQYNKLFLPHDHISVGVEGELSTELRIFALIRLGVVEASMIAKYLNISTNTVYVYKAKVKSRAIVPKDQFEERIMGIGTLIRP